MVAIIVKYMIDPKNVSLSISVTIVWSYKMVCPKKCKQLRKQPEPLIDAKRKAWCLSTSEVNISCYAELQAFVTPLIYYIMNSAGLSICRMWMWRNR